MKIAIYGAGAIGSYLGVRLHQAGAEVSLIARGEQLAAIKENGVTLKAPDGTVTVRPFVTGDAGEAGAQDIVFIALKGHALPRRRARHRAADGAEDDTRHRDERDSLLVSARHRLAVAR